MTVFDEEGRPICIYCKNIIDKRLRARDDQSMCDSCRKIRNKMYLSLKSKLEYKITKIVDKEVKIWMERIKPEVDKKDEVLSLVSRRP